jgi:hypothetical protein
MPLVGGGTAATPNATDACEEPDAAPATVPPYHLPRPSVLPGAEMVERELDDLKHEVTQRKTAIIAPPTTTSTAPATTRGPIRSVRCRSSAEKITPKSDSVATIGATTDTAPR